MQAKLPWKIKNPKQFWTAYNSSKANFSRVPSSLSDGVFTATMAVTQADMLNVTFSKNFTKPTIIPAQPTADANTPVISSVDFDGLDVVKIWDLRHNVPHVQMAFPVSC